MTYSDASNVEIWNLENFKIKIKEKTNGWYSTIFEFTLHPSIVLYSAHGTCEEFQGGTHCFVRAQGNTPSARSKSFSTQGTMPQVTVFRENGAKNLRETKTKERTNNRHTLELKGHTYTCICKHLWCDCFESQLIDEYQLIMVELCCFVFLVLGRPPVYLICVCLCVQADAACSGRYMSSMTGWRPVAVAANRKNKVVETNKNSEYERDSPVHLRLISSSFRMCSMLHWKNNQWSLVEPFISVKLITKIKLKVLSQNLFKCIVQNDSTMQ